MKLVKNKRSTLRFSWEKNMHTAQRIENAIPEEVQLARTVEDLQAVKEFKMDYCSGDRPGLSEFHDDGLNKFAYTLFGTNDENEITSTARLLLDSEHGFPEDGIFPDSVNKMRREGKKLAELGRVVIIGDKLNLLRKIYKAIFEIAILEGIDVVLLVMKQRNLPSHEKIMHNTVLSNDMGLSWDEEQAKLCLVAWDIKASQPEFHRWIDRDSYLFSPQEWDQYSTPHLGSMLSVQREVYYHVANKMYGHVLDIGCGSGRIMAYIQDNPSIENYTGVDSSEEMIQQATWLKDQLKFNEAELIHDKIEAVEAKYDSILSIHSYYSWSKPGKVLSHIYNLLSPTGTFVLVTPNDSFDEDALSHIVKQELLGHPYYDEFLEINYAIAAKAKAKGLYTPLDSLIAQVRAIGFRVNVAHDQFFLGGASYLELSKSS